jgi:hypothetical protein
MSSDPTAPQTHLRHQHNGWTPERQQRFLDHLALHGSVSAAARATGMTKQSAYWLRRQPHAADFARAWDAALADSGRWLEDMAMDRLLDGEEEVIERDGVIVEVRRRPGDVRLLLFHLKRLEDGRRARANMMAAVTLQRMVRRDGAADAGSNWPDAEKVEKLRAELQAMPDAG